MELTLVPLMGPFHLRYPAYNAVSVRDAVAAFAPDAVAVTALEAGALDDPRWQDTDEIALPLAVAPWAGRRGMELTPVGEPSPDPEAAADMRRYLQGYPQARAALSEVDAELRPLDDLLAAPLTLERIEAEVLPRLRAHQERREALFEDGPASDWLRARVGTMAERLLALPATRVAVLASAEHLPFLHDALRDRARLTAPPRVAVSEAARVRGLLDFAFRVEVPEPGNVIARLRELDLPEARYHEANLLLAGGHLAEALERLEAASRGDFAEPYYLPGYLLSRLGQLRDLAGQRDAALRAYRGVRALSYAPPEALEAANAGLEHPFGEE